MDFSAQNQSSLNVIKIRGKRCWEYVSTGFLHQLPEEIVNIFQKIIENYWKIVRFSLQNTKKLHQKLILFLFENKYSNYFVDIIWNCVKKSAKIIFRQKNVSMSTHLWWLISKSLCLNQIIRYFRRLKAKLFHLCHRNWTKRSQK